jgi:hypothetical protein
MMFPSIVVAMVEEVAVGGESRLVLISSKLPVHDVHTMQTANMHPIRPAIAGLLIIDRFIFFILFTFSSV